MDGDFPPNVVELIQRQLSQFGRVGATKVYAVPTLTAVIAAAPAVTTPVISQPQNIRFREPGTVIAIYGQAIAGTVQSFAGTEIRIQIGGQEDVATDGNAGVFVPMLALFGPNLNWFPMWRRAQPGVDWTITYQNRQTGDTTFPSAYLAFIADADLARSIRQPGK